MTEISDSAHSTWTNQFFKSDIHHYNPLADENEELWRKLMTLKQKKEAFEKGGFDYYKSVEVAPDLNETF